MARREKIAAKSVSELVGKVLEPVLARRAGMTLDLMGAWSEILGEPFNTCTRPEKILWKRKASEADPFEPATLVVACDGPRAIFFQHETDQVLAKVNLFFGFEAIGRIKIEQRPVARHVSQEGLSEAAPPTPNEKARLDEILAGIDDEELASRLRAIGEGVLRRNS